MDVIKLLQEQSDAHPRLGLQNLQLLSSPGSFKFGLGGTKLIASRHVFVDTPADRNPMPLRAC